MPAQLYCPNSVGLTPGNGSVISLFCFVAISLAFVLLFSDLVTRNPSENGPSRLVHCFQLRNEIRSVKRSNVGKGFDQNMYADQSLPLIDWTAWTKKASGSGLDKILWRPLGRSLTPEIHSVLSALCIQCIYNLQPMAVLSIPMGIFCLPASLGERLPQGHLF